WRGGRIASQIARASLRREEEAISRAKHQLLRQLEGDAEARREVVVHRIPGEAVVRASELKTAFERQPHLLAEGVIHGVIEIAEAVVTLRGRTVQLIADARVDRNALGNTPGVLKVPAVVEPGDRSEGRFLHIAAGTGPK